MKIYENNNHKMQRKAPLRTDENTKNNQAKAPRTHNKHKGKTRNTNKNDQNTVIAQRQQRGKFCFLGFPTYADYEKLTCFPKKYLFMQIERPKAIRFYLVSSQVSGK